MIIEIVAIETSGLDPEKDIILEAAYGKLSKTGLTGQSFPIDPGDFDLSDEIIQFHTRTGLIPDLLKERIPLADTATWLGPSNLRVVWAKEFAAPFLKRSPLAPALNGIDGKSVLTLGHVIKAVPDWQPVRAGDKVQFLAKALKALVMK